MNQAQKMKNLINNTFELAKTIDGVKTVYISGDFTSHYVKKMFGDVYCYYDNTNDLKQDWTYYNSIHGDDVIRLFEGLKSEYNPIENYDRYEESGISHTGTIGNSGNSTSTSKTSAYDSSTLVTDGEISGNTGNTTTFNNDDTTTSHIHGNIGVVDAPSMLTNESRIRFNSFIEHYINKWLTSIIVGYGSEDNEIEFAQDIEYAKKSEFDALADNVSTISGKVDTLETNYDTLNNSLGGVISDIDNNIKPSIEELIDEVDTTSASVTTLEDQLTANNLPIYLDYQGGKYGYNTSPSRGADTFNPFSSGGGEINFLRGEIAYRNLTTSNHWDISITNSKGKLLLYILTTAVNTVCDVKKNNVALSPSKNIGNGQTGSLICNTQTFIVDIIESDNVSLSFRKTTGSSTQNVGYMAYLIN